MEPGIETSAKPSRNGSTYRREHKQRQKTASTDVTHSHSDTRASEAGVCRGSDKQASKFIRQKQYYDNINTKCKQYNGRLPEGNPSIELVAYSKM